MLSRIFPKQIDNDNRGHQLAIWLLVLFLLAKTFASVTQIGLNPLWTNREVLHGVEGSRSTLSARPQRMPPLYCSLSGASPVSCPPCWA